MLTPVNTLAAVIATAFFDIRHSDPPPPWVDGAQPYLDTMLEMETAEGFYGIDPAEDILKKFLDASEQWKGSLASHVKRQLRQHLKEHDVPQ